MKRKRGEGHINTEGWMMSYADMATILLAMFIVLSTLGKDQTGISFANGTGSFVNAMNSFGLSGLFNTSAKPIALNNPAPHYLYQPRDEEGEGDTRGNDRRRVIDGEEERLQRFLQELGRQFPVERRPRQIGQVIIDLYEPLHKKAPYLGPRHTEVLDQVRPLLERAGFRLYLVVWTPTPTASAWARAAGQAQLAADEFITTSGLQPAAIQRLVPIAQPWRYRDIRRPVLSLVVVKTNDL
jgi:hypothetical protein